MIRVAESASAVERIEAARAFVATPFAGGESLVVGATRAVADDLVRPSGPATARTCWSVASRFESKTAAELTGPLARYRRPVAAYLSVVARVTGRPAMAVLLRL